MYICIYLSQSSLIASCQYKWSGLIVQQTDSVSGWVCLGAKCLISWIYCLTILTWHLHLKSFLKTPSINFCKLLRLSGNFQNVRKLSWISRNFSQCPENFQSYWKFFRSSWKVPKYLEIFHSVLKFPKYLESFKSVHKLSRQLIKLPECLETY